MHGFWSLIPASGSPDGFPNSRVREASVSNFDYAQLQRSHPQPVSDGSMNTEFLGYRHLKSGRSDKHRIFAICMNRTPSIPLIKQ
jgi:hypothetical protein